MFRLRRHLASALDGCGVVAALGRACRWKGVLALAYHRIGSPNGSPFDHGLWSATVDEFDAQVRFFKGQCDVIRPEALPDAVARGRGRFGLITFDDGYRDNYEAAFPVLKAHGVPGVFFVTTAFVDRPRLSWWDEIAWMVRTSTRRAVPAGQWFEADVPLQGPPAGPNREQAVRALLRKFKSLPGDQTEQYVAFLAEATGSGRCTGDDAARIWMTWDMIREMKAAGMSIGGHTVNHPVLARLPVERQREEIAGCKRRVEQETGAPMAAFSYPVGGPMMFNGDTRRCLRDEGVPVAFSYYGGYRRFGPGGGDWDWYDVPRVAVESHVTGQQFRASVQLPGAFARPTC